MDTVPKSILKVGKYGSFQQNLNDMSLFHIYMGILSILFGKRTSYHHRKEYNEMKEQYNENIRIQNDRIKLKDNYAKSLENVLKRYDRIEDEHGLDLQNPNYQVDGSDYSKAIAEFVTEYVEKNGYGKSVSKMAGGMIEQNKESINMIIQQLIDSKIQEALQKQSGNKQTAAFQNDLK